MPKCGSQCWLCDIPIRYDTYKGCSHGCKYCFVQRNGKYELSDIKKDEGPKALKDWISGKRTKETNWCDWDIPLHWGGTSDPFQPVEAIYRASYESLKIFAETKYPFVVSTKGKLIASDEYLQLLDKCNCVVQISAVCSSYDKLEPGCPSFLERVEIMKRVSPHCKRLIVRIQPYMCEVYNEVYENLEKFKDAGAYGVIVEGMKFAKKKPGLVKVAGDYTYPVDVISKDIQKLKKRAHELGLAFYSGENRTRKLGDSLCCCGCSDLQGFKTNSVNINHWANGDRTEPTQRMLQKGTATCFTSLYQNTANSHRIQQNSFVDEINYTLRRKKNMVEQTFNVKLISTDKA